MRSTPARGLWAGEHQGTAQGLTPRTLAALPPFALYQLTMQCRDRSHPLPRQAQDALRAAGFADAQGVISEAARRFVLDRVSGQGLMIQVRGRPMAPPAAGKATGLGLGAARAKQALDQAWMEKIRAHALQSEPELVAGALVDQARIMASAQHKFDVREMAEWTAAAHTLTDANGRVTPALQATIDHVQAKHGASFSKKAKALFQDLVAMTGGTMAGAHQLPLRRDAYWLKGPQPLAGFQSKPELPQEADVVIVGAGLTGASAAYHLAKEAKRQGKTVVVLDAYDPASGASGRNGGNFETLGEQFFGQYGSYDGVVAERFKFLKDAYPDQPDEVLLGQAQRIAEVLTRFALKNAQRMLKTIKDGRIDCDLSKSGWLRTALNPREEKGLVAQAKLARRLGTRIRVMKPETIERTYKLPTKFLGHLIHNNGNYHPAKLVTGELKRAIERGVELYTRTPVESVVSTRADQHQVRTARGTITAKRVIVATNAFTSELFPELSDIKYRRSQVLTLEHVKNDLRGITYTQKDGDLYVNHPKDGHTLDATGQKRGTLLVGAGLDTLAKDPHHPRPQRGIFAKAMQDVVEAHPETRGQPASRAFAGPMAFVEGARGMRMPVIGPLGNGARSGVLIAVFCNGYGGGGCHNTGFHAAKWALSGKLSKEVAADVFSPARLFEKAPLWDTQKAARSGRRALQQETNFSAVLTAGR